MRSSHKRRHPLGDRSTERTAFSLVELVLVVSIIGIIAAIAVPRVSTGAATANANSLEATLTNVRKSIDVYYAEHSCFPGYVPGTQTPDGDHFVDQLTMYSDADGYTNAGRTARYRFGPYLRAPFPSNPTNKLSTVHVKSGPSDADPSQGSVGWVAVLSTGGFGVSATDSELEVIGIRDTLTKTAVRIR